MKPKTKLNLLSSIVLVTLTISIVVAGLITIDDIIVEMNKGLLRNDL